jgi:hypothetical protein
VRTSNVVAALFAVFLPVACAAGKSGSECQTTQRQLGLLPIGAAPKDMKAFSSSDCEATPLRLADCSARDGEGRAYVFFNGALAKVSANANDAKALCLPAGVRFGENVDAAAEKVSAVMGVKLSRSVSPRGEVVYSSDFVAKASTGIRYSIELVADQASKLSEFVERTDF